MIQQKIIDLERFKGGVTLYFKFKNIRDTFFILIKDADSNEHYYKRTYDKPDLTVNLPVHAPRVLVIFQGADLDCWLMGPMKVKKIQYHINEKIRVHRPYALSDIKIRPVRNLPGGSEARFLYHYGIIEYDVDRCAVMAQPVFNFVLDHELHHYFYGRPIPDPEELERLPREIQEHYYNISLEDEKACDEGALYAGINKGYNFSGILHGLMDTLHLTGHYNLDRIIAIHNKILKMHQHLNL